MENAGSGISKTMNFVIVIVNSIIQLFLSNFQKMISNFIYLYF
jgi:hypothetical protein